jgi:hypothetical protein
MTPVAYNFSFLLPFLLYSHVHYMGVAAAHGKMPAASKHAFSFGSKVGTFSAVAALTFMAIDCPDAPNENAVSLDRKPSPSWTKPPPADFSVPISVREMDAGSLAISGACSPFEGGAFDVDHNVEQVRMVLDDLPDEEIDDMIDLPDDYLINTFASSDWDKQFQNGFGVNMVSQGRYFPPVVHTCRRNDAFHASNVWMGPTPALHGLPYSYAHCRRGRRHHFAEVTTLRR